MYKYPIEVVRSLTRGAPDVNIKCHQLPNVKEVTINRRKFDGNEIVGDGIQLTLGTDALGST